MSSQSKLVYLKVLLNVKNNAYEGNLALLKQDLITLRNLLLIDKTNQQMARLYENMEKVYSKRRWPFLFLKFLI